MSPATFIDMGSMKLCPKTAEFPSFFIAARVSPGVTSRREKCPLFPAASPQRWRDLVRVSSGSAVGLGIFSMSLFTFSKKYLSCSSASIFGAGYFYSINDKGLWGSTSFPTQLSF